jgi:homoserine O-acetyltransferase
MNVYKYTYPFITETGALINGLEIGYSTYGEINEAKNNVIWICHALTANSDAITWWTGMIGPGKCFDTDTYFIICANVLGSCYGTTGPLSVNPDSGRQWLHNFPDITIRDIVRVNDLLRQHLKIEQIHLVIGGSIGGFQSMEWAIMQPDLFKFMMLIACSAKASPWVIAYNESQRLALMADKTFRDGFMNKGDSNTSSKQTDGLQGLKAARSIALLSYRTSEAYNQTQAETSNDELTDYRASSYQQYQGEKLVQRFNAYSYYVLTRFIDSHNIFRGRPEINKLLNAINTNVVVVGITTDILYPVSEQKHLASLFPKAEYKEIYSDFGHDGFLIEVDQLTEVIRAFL